MNKDYEKIFSGVSRPKPSDGLFDRVLSCIEQERELSAARKRLFWLSAFSIASLPFIGFSWLGFQSAALESGLFQLTSLAFTDFSAMLSHYQDFAMSVAEAFPVFAVAGLLGGILIFFESSLALVRNAKVAYKSTAATNR